VINEKYGYEESCDTIERLEREKLELLKALEAVNLDLSRSPSTRTILRSTEQLVDSVIRKARGE